MSKQNYIDRPPRVQPELPRAEYAIPNPPNLEENVNQPIIQMALPFMTIIGYVLVAMLGKGRSLLMIVPMGIAVVASTLLAVYTYRRNKQMREEKLAAYARRLVELRKEMENSHQVQRLFYHYNYPPPETTLRMIADLGLDPTLRLEDSRSGSRLWERRSTDEDFAKIRLGTGTLPSTVTYKLPQVEDYDDPLIRDVRRLAEDSLYVSDVSVTIPLRQPLAEPGKESETVARHAIGIVGNNPSAVYEYVRALLVDYTAFHAPTDAQIYVVGTQKARQHWRWAFPLPHCKEAGAIESLCFEEEQEKKGDSEPDKVSLFWKNLQTILDRRRLRLEDEASASDVTLPFLLVVVDILSPIPDGSALRELESNAAVSLLLQEGPRLGASIAFLVPDRTKVPGSCQAVIEVDIDPHEGGKSTFRYAEVGVNTLRYVGTADLVHSQDAARDFARMLEPLSIRRSYGADLAGSVTLLEMIGLASVEELQKLAGENWRKSKVPKTANWLNVALGLLPGNEPRKLTFSAKADGVHGMVAGSTGSGKSELLMTLILGLAINFDPSVVNFVLVDYKGGAAFEPFRNLPHVVDIVTNLEGSATARMFASIKAELDRRQRLNTYSESKDIVHYRKKGLHMREDAPPYPFLFIIIDEFAEMIAGNAEFKSQLESITRLGRALGVHLILAAQRPAGVTDQMRANIKFRICLRVETPEDSRELLRRSDAAYLPPGIPGRGYLQVGNENVELIQVAYIGGDYLGPQANVSPNVIWLNRPKKSEQKKEEAPKLYDVAVNMLVSLSKGEGVPLQWRPWPAFLPRYLTLQSPLDLAYMNENDVAYLRAIADQAPGMTSRQTAAVEADQVSEPSDGKDQPVPRLLLNSGVDRWMRGEHGWKGVDWIRNAMRPVVGIIDNPYDARQLPLTINLPIGHAVLFGASGWGKTTFLRSLITSLAATHSPDELQIYILDFGGRNLMMFKDLPHVGAIITAEEEERIQRLLRKLASIIEHRQNLLSEAGASDIYSYNSKHPEAILPAVLVVVDNFAAFKENFDSLMPPLISLVREARAYGVHFVVAADQSNALSGKLFSLFTERMTLKLSDPAEYANVVGRGVPDMGNIPGRGFLRMGHTPLEFQVALPIGTEEEGSAQRLDEGDRLKALSQTMNEVWAGGWKGEAPATIETLPNRVLLEKVLQSKIEPAGKRVLGVLGLDDLNLVPFRLDLGRMGPHFLVIGPPNSGKTTSLRTLVLSMAHLHSPDEFMMALIDFQRKFYEYGGKHNLGELPHVVQAISKAEQLEEFVACLSVECKEFVANPARKKIYVVIDSYDTFSDEGMKKGRKPLEELAVLAREYGTTGLHFVMSGSLSVTSATDDLRKQIQASNYGLALQTADAISKLNGKPPRSLAEAELPAGRAFIVKSGRTSMVQVATPYTSDDNVEASLDTWVEQILNRYKGKKLAWSRKPEAPPEADKPKIDLEPIKQKLKEKGMGEGLLASLGPEDIIKMAVSYGFIKEEPAKKK